MATKKVLIRTGWNGDGEAAISAFCEDDSASHGDIGIVDEMYPFQDFVLVVDFTPPAKPPAKEPDPIAVTLPVDATARAASITVSSE